MYLSLDDINELYDACSAETLNKDEYWLILLAEQHSDQLPEITERLSKNSIPFCGAVFPGLIVDKRTFKQGAILRKVHCLIPPAILEMPASPDRLNDLLATINCPRDTRPSCLMFLDCLSDGIDHLLENTYKLLGNKCSYFGAGAGMHDLSNSNCIFGEQGLYSNAALILIASEPSHCQARHGWIRHSTPLVANKTDKNVLHELDWESAETTYRKLLPANLRNTPPEHFYKEVAPLFPFAVVHPHSEDVVRDPITVYPNGDVAFLSDIPEGAMMYLVGGTPESLINAAKKAVDATISHQTTSVLVCDCLSRTVALGSQFPAELRTIYESVNSTEQGLSVEGVIALGEIASDGDKAIGFYNKTFGICSFY